MDPPSLRHQVPRESPEVLAAVMSISVVTFLPHQGYFVKLCQVFGDCEWMGHLKRTMIPILFISLAALGLS